MMKMKSLYIFLLLLLSALGAFSQTITANALVTEPILCKGASNATVQITDITGGTQPYIVSWPDGDETAEKNGLSAGFYELTITDSDGITANLTVQVTDTLALSVSSDVLGNVTCAENADGAAIILPEGGSGEYLYKWPDGNTEQSRSDLSAGTYIVSVTDTNVNCVAATALIIDSVEFNVNFSITSGCEPHIIADFKNESIGAVSYLWDFGDGATSDLENPFHIYENPDTINHEVTVRLTATSEYGCVLSHDTTITIYKKPVASFSYSGDMYSGLPVSFMNESENFGYEAVLWEWAFADGSSYETAENPNHYFENADTYTVRLVTEIENGCSDTAFQDVVLLPAPQFLIAADGALSFCEGDSVTISIVDDYGFSAQWYKDGELISGATGRSQLAKQSGSYYALMTLGSLTIPTDTVRVNVFDYPESFSLQAEGELNVCDGDSLKLSVPAISSEYTFRWKNNGTTLNWVASDVFATQNGVYSAIASNHSCETVSSDSITVEFIESPQIPKKLYTSGPTAFCEGDSVNLYISGDYSEYNIQWVKNGAVFENSALSHTVFESGNYSLQASNNKGCSASTDSVSVSVLSYPEKPKITKPQILNECKGKSIALEVAAADAMSYAWKFNGTVVAENSDIFNAVQTGEYTVESSNGSCVQYSEDTVFLTFRNNPIAPEISYTGDLNLCEGDSVLLSYKQLPEIEYYWIYEKERLDFDQTEYTATDPGKYAIVAIDSTQCTDTSYVVIVKDVVLPENPAIYSDGTSQICDGDSVLISSDTIQGVTYVWKWGGAEEASSSAGFYAKNAGYYTLTMRKANCYSNSIDTLHFSVLPAPDKPLVSISGDSEICEGDSVLLTVQQQNGVSYQWQIDGVQTGKNMNKLSAKESGKYGIKVSNSYGCFALLDSAAKIVVNDLPPVPHLSANTAASQLCQGDSAIIYSTSDESVDFNWKKDGGTLLTEVDSLIVKNGGTYTLEVIKNGCTSIADNTLQFEFLPLPRADKNLQTTAKVICEGQTATISVSANDLYRYKWYNTEGPIENEESYSLSVTASGAYRAVVTQPNTGCSVETAPLQLAVYPSPESPVINTSGYTANKCMGDIITLSIDEQEGFNYQWYLNAIALTRDTAPQISRIMDEGVYSVKLDNGVCSALSDNFISINYNASPNPPVIEYLGDREWYMSSDIRDAEAFQWYYNNEKIEGADKFYYEAGKQLGTYRIALKQPEYECYAFSPELKIPEDTWYYVGVEAAAAETSISMYPNPNNGNFALTVTNAYRGQLAVEIESINGTQLFVEKFSKQTEAATFQIECDDCSKGVYLVKLISEGNAEVIKAIIK